VFAHQQHIDSLQQHTHHRNNKLTLYNNNKTHFLQNAKIMVANTAMDNDKIKVFGARVRVDGMDKVCCVTRDLTCNLYVLVLPFRKEHDLICT
jgi:hypothetical protein